MDRRSFLKTSAVLASGVPLSGCLTANDIEDDDSSSDLTSGELFNTRGWISEGESFGTEEYGDEHWKVKVTEIYENKSIDVTVEKSVFDEQGLNKEGAEPMYTFERTGIQIGDMDLIENDFRLGYVDFEDGEAHIGFGDVYVTRERVQEVAANQDSAEE